MSIPRYQQGEKVRVIVEGPVVDVLASGVELTVALETPNASYEVTVPTSHVTIERLAPAGGEPQPGEIWRDAAGVDRYACGDPRSGETWLTGHDGTRRHWQSVHRDPQLGPITRVYPLPVPAAVPQPGPEGDEQGEPRVMVNDVWRAHDDERTHDDGRVTDDDWRATDIYGGLLLMLGDYPATWAEANRDHGPLRLVRRAGYRRTETVVSAGQLRRGTVVSCEEWEDDAPVTITDSRRVIVDDACRLEVEYRPLGWISKITRTAAPDARITLWTGQAVTA